MKILKHEIYTKKDKHFNIIHLGHYVISDCGNIYIRQESEHHTFSDIRHTYDWSSPQNFIDGEIIYCIWGTNDLETEFQKCLINWKRQRKLERIYEKTV